jgi:DNA repair protein RadC
MTYDFSSLSVSTVDTCAFLVREQTGAYRPAQFDEVLRAAQQMLVSRVRGSNGLAAPQDVRDFLAVRLGGLEHEVSAVLHLDAGNRVIDYVEMFRGTLTQTAVYPREVLKDAMGRNSASLVLVHNHPSGLGSPSRADELLTKTIKTTLALVDVRVIDHMIVAGASVVSMAELGLL